MVSGVLMESLGTLVPNGQEAAVFRSSVGGNHPQAMHVWE